METLILYFGYVLFLCGIAFSIWLIYKVVKGEDNF